MVTLDHRSSYEAVGQYRDWAAALTKIQNSNYTPLFGASAICIIRVICLMILVWIIVEIVRIIEITNMSECVGYGLRQFLDRMTKAIRQQKDSVIACTCAFKVPFYLTDLICDCVTIWMKNIPILTLIWHYVVRTIIKLSLFSQTFWCVLVRTSSQLHMMVLCCCWCCLWSIETNNIFCRFVE